MILVVVKAVTTLLMNNAMRGAKEMRVGNLVTWYSENVQDIGLVTKYREIGASWYIVWNSNNGNGWFDENHPSIGIIR